MFKDDFNGDTAADSVWYGSDDGIETHFSKKERVATSGQTYDISYFDDYIHALSLDSPKDNGV